jgi:hypothetical protein
MLCHRNGVGGHDNLTRYGLDFHRRRFVQGLSIDAAFAALEGLVSDRDGWTNLQEIAAVTFPGDSTDRPRSGSTVTTSAAVVADDGGVNEVGITSTVVNTGPGTAVSVQPLDGSGGTPVMLTFADVTQPGDTSLTTGATGPAPPAGFQLGMPALYYEVTTTAAYAGSITICIDYAGASFTDITNLRLLHYEGGGWVDVTTSSDTVNQVICGAVASLSPFLIAQLTDFTPPVLTLPGNQVLEATGPAGAVATFVATAIDGRRRIAARRLRSALGFDLRAGVDDRDLRIERHSRQRRPRQLHRAGARHHAADPEPARNPGLRGHESHGRRGRFRRRRHGRRRRRSPGDLLAGSGRELPAWSDDRDLLVERPPRQHGHRRLHRAGARHHAARGRLHARRLPGQQG